MYGYEKKGKEVLLILDLFGRVVVNTSNKKLNLIKSIKSNDKKIFRKFKQFDEKFSSWCFIR